MTIDEPHPADNPVELAYHLVVVSTFTAEPIHDALGCWMNELGVSSSIEFAPYNQIFQQLLDPGSALARNRKGANVILVRIEDWCRSHGGPADHGKLDDHLQRYAIDLIDALRTALTRASVPLIVGFCPASRRTWADPAARAAFRRVEEEIRAALSGTTGLCLIGRDDFCAYAVTDYDDPQRDELGHVPYTPLFYAALATIVARRIHALVNPPYKVIVLDCDNTLWKGVVGEEGTAGITIPPAWRALQQFMAECSSRGFLLCLASKNDEADVLEVFERRPDMILKREHLVSWRINWRPKSENIRSLAEELNLGLDSFIFVDDNPLECAEVRAACPEVLTLLLPIDGEITPFLDHVWAFDRFHLTAEDQERTAMYRQEIERGRFLKRALTMEEFLAALDLKIKISEPARSQWPRVAQLTQRTNQFNFTTVRRTDGEVQRLEDSGLACRIVEVSDRFGDYGLVGVMIVGQRDATLVIDTFLLSCRALGRGVEHRMLRTLGEIAQERRLSQVNATLISTAKNRPAFDFLESVAAPWRQEVQSGWQYCIPAEIAANLTYDSAAVPAGAPSAADKPPVLAMNRPAGSEVKWQRYERIATSLSSPEQVLGLVQARQDHQRPRALVNTHFIAPRTKVEQSLADLWAQLLRWKPVGIRDNFFELGGTSLLAVDLFAQIEHRLGAKLPLTSLIEAPTIEQLAQILASATERDSLVLIRDGGTKPPLFLVHDGDGETMLYRNLAMLLAPGHRVFGLQPRTWKNVRMVHTRIPEMAAHHIDRIRSIQPHGPYLLGGMCAGGVIAFEIGRQLQSQGETVALIALIDAADVEAPSKAWRFAQQRFHSFSMVFRQGETGRLDRRVVSVAAKALRKVKNLTTYVVLQRLKNVSDELRMRRFRACVARSQPLPQGLEQISVRTVYLFAEKHYRPEGCFSGRLTLFRATCGEGNDEPYVNRYDDPLLGWGRRATLGIEPYDVPGGHSSMLQEPHVQALAKQLQSSIDQALGVWNSSEVSQHAGRTVVVEDSTPCKPKVEDYAQNDGFIMASQLQ
jgi:FkbH-like protein